MTLRGCALLVAVAAGFLVPSRLRAHATEFILGKIMSGPGSLEVELTADYGGNPMFAGKEDARAALEKLLRVEIGGRDQAMTALAPIRFEERSRHDPEAPIPPDPANDGQPLQLLCARWSWQTEHAERIAFTMPPDAGQTVILWMPAASPGGKPRWSFLLPGETSPPVKISGAVREADWRLPAVLSGLLLVAILWRRPAL